MLGLERRLFGRVSERVIHRPSVDEQLIRSTALRGHVLQALDAFGVGDVYQVRERITELHPVRSRRQAAPREVWQALLGLQFDGVVECETVTEKDKHGKPQARFLWSRKPAE